MAENKSLEGREVVVRVFVGNGYIQWKTGAEKGIVLVSAARVLGVRASYEFNWRGMQLAKSKAQINRAYAELHNAAAAKNTTLAQVLENETAKRAAYTPASA